MTTDQTPQPTQRTVAGADGPPPSKPADQPKPRTAVTHASGPRKDQPVAAPPPSLPAEAEPCGRQRPCPDHPPGMPGGCTRRWGDWDDLPSSGACPDCGWGRPAHPTAVVGSEPARDTEAATTPAPQADAAAVRDGRCGCRTDEEHAKVTTAFSRPADWLGGEFSRADEALSALPPWAQPVITRRSTPAPGVAGGSPAILGRALLDGEDELWWPDGDRWRHAASSERRTRQHVEEHYDPVREVLLVDPAAGRVIQTAAAARQAERDADDPGGWGRWQDAIEAHHAAVDALDGDHPAEPAPEPDSGPGWVDRRAWTRQQWLDDARAIFYSVHGGAADLLNGHIMALFGELHAVTEQRDLAIDHDRQPYPTAEAYERVCAALEKHRQRADTATGKVLEEHLAYQQMLDRAEAAEARLEAAERDRDRYRASLPAEAQDYWHWADDLADAPAVFALPAEPPPGGEMWDSIGKRWFTDADDLSPQMWWCDDSLLRPRYWPDLLRRGPLSTVPPERGEVSDAG